MKGTVNRQSGYVGLRIQQMQNAQKHDDMIRQIETVPVSGSPNVWSVELIDYVDEGACYVTVFHGPRSKERADTYANWLRTQ